ncbi:hypothetical protein EI94DRAFT_1727639 [Lactarius quietus]|nr:hypothetical protein EI94DRAFT_1727639 [Lactarius quietus]
MPLTQCDYAATPPLLICRHPWVPLTTYALIRCSSCERANSMTYLTLILGASAALSSTLVPEHYAASLLTTRVRCTQTFSCAVRLPFRSTQPQPQQRAIAYLNPPSLSNSTPSCNLNLPLFPSLLFLRPRISDSFSLFFEMPSRADPAEAGRGRHCHALRLRTCTRLLRTLAQCVHSRSTGGPGACPSQPLRTSCRQPRATRIRW